jgi:homoserine dehydrogenase
VRIIVIGTGIVGGSFIKLLSLRTADLIRDFGIRPRLVAVADEYGAAINSQGLDQERLLATIKKKGSVCHDPKFGNPGLTGVEVIRENDAEVVVEATPTNVVNGEPGMSHIRTALTERKNVITSNKGPLALALPALLELAQYNGVHLRFSGTVGGGTPILDFAKRSLLGDQIISVQGILNGTTNYILTQMTDEGLPFDVALKEAQKAGFAEANPSMDIDGYDTAAKIVIIANWILKKRVTLKNVELRGIRNITLKEVKDAASKGKRLKLIASAEGGIQVAPKAIPIDHPLCVSGVLNAVTFTSKYAGEETIVGRGAGGMETASALLRDLLEIKNQLARINI